MTPRQFLLCMIDELLECSDPEFAKAILEAYREIIANSPHFSDEEVPTKRLKDVTRRVRDRTQGELGRAD